MKNVAVVIPAYSETLAKHEMISLRQICNVLKDYDKIFVAPEGLNCNYGDFCAGMQVFYFNKAFFKSTITYSQLLLSKGFYERFHEYEYILIHQLDAFVFRDRLKEFCDMGYDYIGAPALKYVPLWHYMGARIGNGGLSLRKVESCHRIVGKRELFTEHPFRGDFMMYEDTVFGFAGTQPKLHFRLPDVKTARRFALQDEVQHALRGPVIELPFGVHGWQKINTPLWTKIINELFGYDTEGIVGEDIDYRRRFLKFLLRVRKVINVNIVFGMIQKEKPEEALAYFLKWQENAECPKEDAYLVTAFMQRIAQYCRFMQMMGRNPLPYILMENALEYMVEKWKDL